MIRSEGHMKNVIIVLACWANRRNKNMSGSESTQLGPQQRWPPDQRIIVFRSEGLWDGREGQEEPGR